MDSRKENQNQFDDFIHTYIRINAIMGPPNIGGYIHCTRQRRILRRI